MKRAFWIFSAACLLAALLGWFCGRAGARAENAALLRRIADLEKRTDWQVARTDMIVQSFSPAMAHARDDHETLVQVLGSIDVLNRQQHSNAAMQDRIVAAWNREQRRQHAAK